MSVQHHHRAHHRTTRRRKARQFWLREENILGALAALIAFIAIYAYSGDARFFYPIAGAMSMGAVIYAATWMATHRKS